MTVVGAGLAGLTAALTLARAGVRVSIFEGADVLGGRLATHGVFEFEHAGRVWSLPDEHGIHGVWRQYRNLQRLLGTLRAPPGGGLRDAGDQGLVVRGREIVPMGERVRRSVLPDVLAQAALFAEPAYRAAAAAAGPAGLARVARGLSAALAFDYAGDSAGALDHISVAEFTRRWPPVLERMIAALTHSAFFRDPSEVSLAAFLTGLDLYVVRDKRNSGFQVWQADTRTCLLEPMVSELSALRGAIHLSAPVEAVCLDHRGEVDGVQLRSGARIAGRAVVVALDPAGFSALRVLDTRGFSMDATRKLGVALSPERLAADSVVVRAVFGRDVRSVTPASGVFAGGPADNYFWLSRLQRPFEAWTRQVGGSVLECHLYGRNADRARSLPDAAVGRRVVDAATHLWPELGASCVHVQVRRNPRTHATFPPGDFGRLPSAETRVAGLALCGDWIASAAPVLYLERATRTALEAARVVAPRLGLDAATLPEPLAPDAPAPTVGLGQRALRAGGLARVWTGLPF